MKPQSVSPRNLSPKNVSPKKHSPKKRVLRVPVVIILIALPVAGFIFAQRADWQHVIRRYRFGQLPPVKPKSPTAALLLAGAKAQVGTTYDARYRDISYPGGDVPKGIGACTDVIVRAGRSAGFDLQKLIHEDMARNFAVYPHKWGLTAPNPSIDHRRVPNQMRFFSRNGKTLTKEVSPATLGQWQPGDFVYWNTGRTLHTGVISDERNEYGEPLVIHNGWRCIEEDALTRWAIIGHYRYGGPGAVKFERQAVAIERIG